LSTVTGFSLLLLLLCSASITPKCCSLPWTAMAELPLLGTVNVAPPNSTRDGLLRRI
jgi:hypothetical protein